MKTLLLLFLLFPIYSFSQLEKLLKKDISEDVINKSLEATKIIIGQDSIIYKKIPRKMVDKMVTEDPKVMVNGCKFCDLNAYLINIKEAIDKIVTNLDNGEIPYIMSLKSDIIMANRLYPEINLEGYYSLIDFFEKANDHNDARNVKLQKIEQQRLNEEMKYDDSLRRYVDSVKTYKDSAKIATDDSIYEAKEQEDIKKEKQDKIQFRKYCINKFGLKSGSMIADGNVALGMSKIMCLYAWGRPSKSNQTRLGDGLLSETWFYGQYFNRWLIFKNGILVSIFQ